MQEFNGIELLHFYTLQGAEQIGFLIGHYCRMDMIGNKIDIIIASTQLLAGCKKPVLSPGTELSKYIPEEVWVISVWKFLESKNGSLTFTQEYIPPKQREFD